MASMEERKNMKNMKKRSSKSKTKTLTLEKVKALGHDLLSSRSHINNLPILISYLSSSSPLDVSLETLITLQSFFIPLVPEIPSKNLEISSGKEEDAELVYRIWLRKRFDEFVSLLVDIVVYSEAETALMDVVLETLMEFVKSGKDGKFQSAIYHRFLQTIVNSTSSVDRLLEMLAENYFTYLDVRYFTYTSLDKIAKDCDVRHMAGNLKGTKQSDMQSGKELSSNEMAVRHIHNVLSRVPPLESLENDSSHEMWSQSGLSSDEADKPPSELSEDSKPHKSKALSNSNILKKIKLRFTKAWLSFLKLPLPLDIYKEVLVSLQQNVFPYMANPAVLCDFLTRSYDIGGVISVMALSGLFVLMTQHGLEYPKFYEKLYASLTPAVFMAKHRAVFFQLLDTCLKSAHLPAYLAAAFAKKLSRLSLSVPPPGELVIIALIHNLLRRHPSINFLVHKQSDEDTAQDAFMEGNNTVQSGKQGVDPFKIEEDDPSKSGAMCSSLWEIDSLRNHYCPAISRFVASLENDLTVRAKTSEVAIADFSSGSYATIFRDEMRRRIKQVPLAFYKVTPNTLFLESELAGWYFGNAQNNTEASKSVEEDEDMHAKKQKISSN